MFVSMGYRFQYEAGTPLVLNNDLGETFFLILNGIAKLVLVNTMSEEVNVTLFRAGDFFGELSMLESRPIRSANIIAITPIEVVAIQKKDFLKAMQQCPMLALNLARVLGERLRSMNERMVTSRLPDDMHKVAHTLLILAKKGKTFNEGGPILLPVLSLKEWAAFCYTDGEGFMKSMEQLKGQGILEWQNQRIAITRIDGLRKVAEVHQQRIENIQTS
jgi:CRP-like cAMP-binding protein